MKTPLFRLQYELDTPHSEAGTDTGARLTVDDVTDSEVRQALAKVSQLGYKETVKYLSNIQESDPHIVMVPLTTRTPEALRYRLEGLTPKLVFMARPLHTIERLDEQLAAANQGIPTGCYLCCHSMTAAMKRRINESKYPWGIHHVVNGLEYMWHRVFPKLKLTHGIYFALTQGKNRIMSRVEIIGRLFRTGFEVVDEQFREGEYFVIARKASAPIDDTPPTGSPIIHLRRIGKDGKEIAVHKFRTMYTYSEYVQTYIYHYQNLDRGGKFKDDYRINFWGHLLRRLWLDELPMLWNMVNGEIKLVGVRPLSRQYYSLYTPEMQQMRIRTKPGLLPPFYYDEHTPETLEEVQESERRYLEAYLKKPFATDWKYFWGIVGNILIHRKRSA